MRRFGLDHFVYDAIVHRLFGGHEEVAVAVGLDLVLRLAAVIGNLMVTGRIEG